MKYRCPFSYYWHSQNEWVVGRFNVLREWLFHSAYKTSDEAARAVYRLNNQEEL